MLDIPIISWLILFSVIAIVIIAIPFTLFSLKGRADEIAKNTKEINEHLRMLRQEIAINISSQKPEVSPREQVSPSVLKAQR